MSKHEIIIQMLKGIEQTLAQQALVHDLVHKDVLNTMEAALYMGRSVNAVYKLRSRHKLPSYKPSNGKLYFNKLELFDWMMSDSPAIITGNRKQLVAPEETPAQLETMAETEEEDSSDDEDEEAKMAIFNQEGG